MRDFVAARRAPCAYPSLRSQFRQFWRCAPTVPEGRAMNKNITVVLLLVLAAGCSTNPQDGAYPPMDPTRKVSRQVCTRQIDTTDGGNLLCRDETEADRRARIAEEERQARARKEAEERAARERLERERAEQLAREAAERECRRLAQERLDGRALLVSFVDNYGKVEENKGIAGQITTFLSKARKVEPCPPANSTPQLGRTDNQLAKPR